MNMNNTSNLLDNMTVTITELLEEALYQEAMHAEYGDEANKPVCYTTLADRLKQALGQIVGDDHAFNEYERLEHKAGRRVYGDYY